MAAKAAKLKKVSAAVWEDYFYTQVEKNADLEEKLEVLVAGLKRIAEKDACPAALEAKDLLAAVAS
jgi:hypothetical protein